MSYTQVTTSAEVWAVIKARHGKDLKVFESFSDLDGTFNGGPGERGRMITAYGFDGAPEPILRAETTWRINPDKPYERPDEEHRYWLCIATFSDESVTAPEIVERCARICESVCEQSCNSLVRSGCKVCAGRIRDEFKLEIGTL